PADDLVGMVGLELVEFADELVAPRQVIGRFSVGSGEGGHDVAGAITAVGLVAQHRGFNGLAAVVVEAALCNMLAQAYSENAAQKTQSYRDPDHDVTVPVHSSTPPGEHASSLLDRQRPAHRFSSVTHARSTALTAAGTAAATHPDQAANLVRSAATVPGRRRRCPPDRRSPR